MNRRPRLLCRSPRAIIAAIVIATSLLAPSAFALPRVGDKAPTFKLPYYDDAGRRIGSRELFKEGETLVSFFAVWCKQCEEEIALFGELEKKYGDRGFKVVLISLDRLSVNRLEQYLDETGGTELTVLSDLQGKSKSAYGVNVLPTNLLVGADGRIIDIWEGYLPGKLEWLKERVGQLTPPEKR